MSPGGEAEQKKRRSNNTGIEDEKKRENATGLWEITCPWGQKERGKLARSQINRPKTPAWGLRKKQQKDDVKRNFDELSLRDGKLNRTRGPFQ